MPIKKFKPLSPDPALNKIKGDNEFARLAHLNSLVEQINNNGGGGGGSLPYKVYSAMLSCTPTHQTSGTLVVGKRYEVDYGLNSGDDFSNVGYVEPYVPFTATGTTPTNWTNGTYVYDYDSLLPQTNVLENTLGGNITYDYVYVPYDGYFYKLTSDGLFTENKTVVTSAYGLANDSIDRFDTMSFFPNFRNNPDLPNSFLLGLQWDGSETYSGNFFRDVFLEIRVYN